MIRKKTILLFNIAGCALFLIFGILSTQLIETLVPSLGITVILPPLETTAKNRLLESNDLEQVRTQALFYYNLSTDLKRKQSTVELRELHAVRYVSYAFALMLAIGGLLTFFLKDEGPRIARGVPLDKGSVDGEQTDSSGS